MPDEASEKSAADVESAASAPTDAASETHPSEAPATTNGEPTSSPRRKRKRKKRAPEAAPEPAAPALTADGRERPIFVLGFPHDPELDRLVRAFELGNYAYVRKHAPKLVAQGGSEEIRAAARELARRIEPDPLIKILLALSIALLVALAFWAYKTHGV
jgi:hypothetical protein